MSWIKNPQSTLQSFLEVVEAVILRTVRTQVVLPVSASNVTQMDLARGDAWTYTPTEAATVSAINHAPGTIVTLTVQATGSSRVITFGAGFGTTGTLTTGTDATKKFQMVFVSDGVSLNEASRSTALTVS